MVRGGARGRAPLSLALPALVTVALLLLPLAYLVARAGSGGSRAWHVLWRRSTAELLWSTGLLVVGVTAASVAIGVTLAWLVTRTDLPGRRAWAVAGTLPLVIPSYVAAFCLLGAFGPRGLLQQLLGVERLPEVYGYPGALLALTLSTYPYVLLLTAAAFRGLDPALEEAARGLGRTPVQTFRQVTLPALRPAISAGALLVALYSLSDFGVVSLMRYDALTRAIYLQYRALFDRTPAAVLALVLVALTALVLLVEGRSRRRTHGSSPGVARRPR
ncbi:MAG: iron ABC transporter permease, partial [Actinobacteria bacterium]|nr:iron ABC transporter permease [Actinomycetota bacterium]